MIEQKFQQEGMFQETDSKSLFPKIADLILVFSLLLESLFGIL